MADTLTVDNFGDPIKTLVAHDPVLNKKLVVYTQLGIVCSVRFVVTTHNDIYITHSFDLPYILDFYNKIGSKDF